MSVFLDAIKVLEERGWCQGDYQDEKGRVCLVGAVGLVVSDRPAAPALDERYYPLHKTLQRVIGSRLVSAWNDDPLTTYEDAVLCLKRAHELSEEQS